MLARAIITVYAMKLKTRFKAFKITFPEALETGV